MTQVVIEILRLRLRPVERADAALIALYTSDERVASMTSSIPHPLPPGASEAFVDRVLAGLQEETVWAIDHKASQGGALVGLVGVSNDGEIGYWLGAPFWATGFATEAVQAVVVHALTEGRWSELTGEVFQDNPASAKVLTKVGFEFVGEGESHSVARGASVSVWRYKIGQSGLRELGVEADASV